MGKARIIAETGAGQHGVGIGDGVRAARPGVHRLHGRRGHAPPAAQRPAHAAARARGRGRSRPATRTLKEAVVRGDPRLGHERRHHALRHRLGVGPAPVPGDRARPAARDRRRGARPAARARRDACRTACSPASAAAPTRSGSSPPFVDDESVALVGVEAGGRGPRDRPPRRAADRRRARPGVLHGALIALLQNDEGQIIEAHSISAGLDYPGVGPRARLAARQRPRELRRRHRRARRWPALRDVARLEGIIPALETAHALHYVLREPSDSALDLVCLSGRGDKDLAEVMARAARRGRRERMSAPATVAGAERIAAAFEDGRQARRADALPDGRLPGRRRRRGRSARPTPTAAPTSSSSAFRSPTRSPTGPSSRPPATAALRAGATVDGVLASARGARRAAPGRAHVLREPRARARAGALRRRLAERRRQRADRPRPAARGGAGDARRVRRGRARARAAGRADDARRAPGARSASARAASSTPSR